MNGQNAKTVCTRRFLTAGTNALSISGETHKNRSCSSIGSSRILRHPVYGEGFCLRCSLEIRRYLLAFRVLSFLSGEEQHMIVYSELFLHNNQGLPCGLVQESSLIAYSPPALHHLHDISHSTALTIYMYYSAPLGDVENSRKIRHVSPFSYRYFLRRAHACFGSKL